MARTALIRLAIEQEIAEDAGGRPEEAICPALDTGLVLVEDEDGAGGDHAPFGVDEAAGNARDESSSGGLEDEEGV